MVNDSLFYGKTLATLPGYQFMSDLDDVNFPEIVANCIFSFWGSPEEYRGDLTAK
jgi:hypothetical protein